ARRAPGAVKVAGVLAGLTIGSDA
ncbi:MAG: hypothetical protein QOE84_1886, partial [Actinomycetota bacterium]|nr:hypothetical protein [Actinomycetota bacterium]